MTVNTETVTKTSNPTVPSGEGHVPIASKTSEGLICQSLVVHPDWEMNTRCTILQYRPIGTAEEKADGRSVSGFLIQRCREDNSLYGGTLFVLATDLRTHDERWMWNDSCPFDDDIPF